MGDRVRLASNITIVKSGVLAIGAETFIGHQALIAGGDAEIIIGERCDIAPRVTIVNGSHYIDIQGNRVAGVGRSEPIVLGDGCWICAGATILNGTTIGAHSIVAAGAVAKGLYPPYSLIAGVPAKVIKQLLV